MNSSFTWAQAQPLLAQGIGIRSARIAPNFLAMRAQSQPITNVRPVIDLPQQL